MSRFGVDNNNGRIQRRFGLNARPNYRPTSMSGEFGPDLESACQIVGNRKRKQLDLSGQQSRGSFSFAPEV
jgi:hypothetical protein